MSIVHGSQSRIYDPRSLDNCSIGSMIQSDPMVKLGSRSWIPLDPSVIFWIGSWIPSDP